MRCQSPHRHSSSLKSLNGQIRSRIKVLKGTRAPAPFYATDKRWISPRSRKRRLLRCRFIARQPRPSLEKKVVWSFLQTNRPLSRPCMSALKTDSSHSDFALSVQPQPQLVKLATLPKNGVLLLLPVGLGARFCLRHLFRASDGCLKQVAEAQATGRAGTRPTLEGGDAWK